MLAQHAYFMNKYFANSSRARKINVRRFMFSGCMATLVQRMDSLGEDDGLPFISNVYCHDLYNKTQHTRLLAVMALGCTLINTGYYLA